MTNHTRAFAAIVGVGLALAIGACNVETPGPISPASPNPTAPNRENAGNYLVQGVISEAMTNGPAPLAGATEEITACYRSNPNALTSVLTDAAGAYRVTGVCAGTAYIWAYKSGYVNTVKPPVQCDGDCFQLTIDGDTRFDTELVRQ